MRYRDQDKKWHSLESDIIDMNYEHGHPLVKQDVAGKITVYCPICDVVFGVIIK